MPTERDAGVECQILNTEKGLRTIPKHIHTQMKTRRLRRDYGKWVKIC